MMHVLLKLKPFALLILFFSILVVPLIVPTTSEAAFSQEKKIAGCTFYSRITDAKGNPLSTIKPQTTYFVEVSWSPGTGDNAACDNFDSVEVGYYTAGISYGFTPQYCNLSAKLTGTKRIAKAQFTTANDPVIRKYIKPQNGVVVCDENVRGTGYVDQALLLNGAVGTTTTPVNQTGGTPTNTGTNTPGTVPNTNTGANFNVDLDSSVGSFFNPLSARTLPEIVAGLIRILFVLIGIAAVIVIIISGFRMVLANGNEAQLTAAKKALLWAVVGLVVSLMAFSIVAIIQRLIQVGA